MEEQRERQSRKRGKSGGKSLLPFFLIFFCFILLFAGAGLFYYEVYAHQSQSGFKQLFFRIRRQCGAVFKP